MHARMTIDCDAPGGFARHYEVIVPVPYQGGPEPAVETALEGEIARLTEQLEYAPWKASYQDAQAKLTALTAAHARVKVELHALWLKEEQIAIDALTRAEEAEAALAEMTNERNGCMRTAEEQAGLYTAALDRAVKAEAALAVALGYVTHKADCAVLNCRKPSHNGAPCADCTCTCGAAAVLSQKGPIT